MWKKNSSKWRGYSIILALMILIYCLWSEDISSHSKDFFDDLRIKWKAMFLLNDQPKVSKAEQIAQFWHWFKREWDQGSFVNCTEEQSDEVYKRLTAINNSLGWRLGPGEKTEYEVVISAGEAKQVFPLAKEIVAKAPAMKDLQVVALIPRMKHLQTASYGNMKVQPDQIFFTLSQQNNQKNLCIYLNENEPPETYMYIGYLFLDMSLGEAAAATEINEVTFESITKAKAQGARPFSELAKTIDDIAAKK